MAEPVLVIHGVANRDKAGFEAEVKRLNDKIGPQWNLIPVFWGDLGGKSADIADCLPKLDGGEWTVRSLEGAAPSEEVRSALGGSRSTDDRARIVASAAGESNEVVRSQDSLESAIRDEIEAGQFLKYVDDEEVLRSVGEAVRAATEAEGDGGEFAVRGFGDVTASIRDAARRVVKSFDNALGKTAENMLGKKNQALREVAMPWFSLFFGDIFAYQRQQELVRQRVRDAMPAGYGTKDNPISIVAHSLGGIVIFDMAVQPSEADRLWIKTFVTFGSQSAFFHILDPRSELAVYAHDHPVALPASIGNWVNLWHPLDILGFTASTVFRLQNGKPKDVPVSEGVSHLASEKLWAHSIYWQTEELVDELKAAL